MLSLLGAAALMALLTFIWQRQRPAIIVTSNPILIEAENWDAALADVRQVDLNVASTKELERLPDVGPSLAERIVAYRSQNGRFRNPEELMNVRGIGPKTYKSVQEYIVVK